jgi:hypothetical protein
MIDYIHYWLFVKDMEIVGMLVGLEHLGEIKI